MFQVAIVQKYCLKNGYKIQAQNKTDDSYESAGWLVEGRHGWRIFCPLWLLGLICFQWHLFGSNRNGSLLQAFHPHQQAVPGLVSFVPMSEVQRVSGKMHEAFYNRTLPSMGHWLTHPNSESQVQRSGKYCALEETKDENMGARRVKKW